MGPQQVAAREVKGVVHRAGRVILRDVKRSEIVEVVLYFRARTDPEPGIPKYLLYPDAGTRDRVASTGTEAPPRQRYVDSISRKPGLEGLRLQRFAASIQLRDDGLLGFVDRLSGRRSLVSRQRREPLEETGQLALLAEVRHANGIQRSKLRRRFYLGRCCINELLEILHAASQRPGRIYLPGRLRY